MAMKADNIRMPFVLIRDFNFAGDNLFGVYDESLQWYRFGDGDCYTYEQLDSYFKNGMVEWLSWDDVEKRLAMTTRNDKP